LRLLCNEIDDPVGIRQLDIDLGKPGQKFRQRRRQLMQAKVGDGIHPQ